MHFMLQQQEILHFIHQASHIDMEMTSRQLSILFLQMPGKIHTQEAIYTSNNRC